MAFYIHVVNGYEALKDYAVTGLSVTADGKSVPVTLGNVGWGEYTNDDGETGLEITLYNGYGSGPFAVNPIANINSTLSVTFTLGTSGSEAPVNPGQPTEPDETEPETTLPGETEAPEETTEATEAPEETTVAAKGNAYLCCAAAEDWWPLVWMDTDTAITANVTGAGTYTMSWNLNEWGWETVDGLSVLYIDIVDPTSSLAGCYVSNLVVTADGAAVPVTLGNVRHYYEGGCYRIEIYNMYSPYAGAVSSSLTFSQNLTVSFTLAESDGDNADTGDGTNLTALYAAMLVATAGIMALVPMKKKFF